MSGNSDASMDTSDDDESSTNESASDSSDDSIPVIKESKVSASTSAGIPLLFLSIIFLCKFL